MRTRLLVDERGHWTVLRAIGDLDLASAPAIRHDIRDATTRYRQLIIDLKDVDVLDSVGLGLLIGALRRIKGSGGTLRLVVQNPALQSILAQSGLDQIFDVYIDVLTAQNADLLRDSVEQSPSAVSTAGNGGAP